MPWFSRKPKASEDGSPRDAVRAYEEALPDAALHAARNEYFDITGQPHVNSARMFLIAVLAIVVAIVEGIALAKLPSENAVKPYVVFVNKDASEVSTGRAAVMPAEKYEPEVGIIDRELFNFVKNMYTLNADAMPVAIQAHKDAYAFTRDRATAELRDFIDKREQAYQRMKTTPGLIRTVVKKTMTHRSDAPVVLIRFTALERSRGQVEGIPRNYVMQVSYVRTQPMTKEQLELNPLGIYITHFDIQEEN